VASLKFRVVFGRDDPFFALNIVNFSFLHDEGRLDDALHHFHSIELVNALRMVVSWSILVTRHRYLAFPRCLFRYDLPHTSNTMVQINSSNVQPRRVRGSGGGASNTNILSQAMAYIDTLPYLANLSPIDRLLVFVGISLFFVVTLAYMLLLSGIFTSSSNSSGGGFGLSGRGSSSATNDPRLSNELRKTGLSDEALLRRGGGRRIHIGPKVLDSTENAVALDIAKILDCPALQDEMEREWAKVLDDIKLAEKTSSSKTKTYNYSGGGGSGNSNSYKGNSNNSDNINNDNDLKNKWNNADDYAAELAAEINSNNNNNINNGGSSSGGRSRRLSDTTGKSDTGYDDFGMYERPLEEEYYGNKYTQSPPQPPPGLQLTARHLFCLIAEALTLPTIITLYYLGFWITITSIYIFI